MFVQKLPLSNFTTAHCNAGKSFAAKPFIRNKNSPTTKKARIAASFFLSFSKGLVLRSVFRIVLGFGVFLSFRFFGRFFRECTFGFSRFGLAFDTFLFQIVIAR